ncbi:MAG: asparagine synthase B [Thermovirgaceae bacterium]
MSGLFGIWGDNDEVTFHTMMEDLRHRGSDATGSVTGEDFSIGHCRLAVMDPENGDRPLYNEDGNFSIVSDARIYNSPALRGELSKRHEFRTGNDSEVILHLFEEHGPKAVEQLDGMFALCITDGNSLFLARDPLGIKPLYYGKDKNGVFHFSSEIQSFPHNVGEIREFPTGTWYHSEHGFHTYYEIPDVKPQQDADEKALVGEIRETLEKSVEKHLMSDVPVGVFLSGGLDSSIIAALAAKGLSPLLSFTTGTPDSHDLKAAKEMSEHLGTIHHVYELTEEDIADHLPMIISRLESFDQDLVRTSVPCYFTSMLAARYVKVILTGEGADELFAGYTYYKDIDRPEILAQELRVSLAGLHNVGLQRIDRMTLSHSLEGRSPFLDGKMIALGQRIPPQLKLKGDPPMEKWILRKAFEEDLPEGIAWRKKEQFDEGSGVIGLLQKIARKSFPGDSWKKFRDDRPQVQLRSAEECYYYSIFEKVFEEPETVADMVARWSKRKLPA